MTATLYLLSTLPLLVLLVVASIERRPRSVTPPADQAASGATTTAPVEPEPERELVGAATARR